MEGAHSFVDFRETAPGAATEDMFKGREKDSLLGGLAVAVPGELRGLHHLHKSYGRLPWNTIIRPSVEIADKGFLIGTFLSQQIKGSNAETGYMMKEPWASEFAPNGTLVSLGDILRRPRLAQTLRLIAKNGVQELYSSRGTLARELTQEVQRHGGNITPDDLRNYTVVERIPLEIQYRGYRIITTSAPSGGSVVLSALKVVEGYPDIGSASALNLSTHRFDEALRFAYGQRTELGDPLFVPSLAEYELSMINSSTANFVRDKIVDAHTLPVEAYNPKSLEVLPTPGTSHLVAADRYGMVVTLTSTINTRFGSQIMLPKSGIILNNQMNDFSIPNSTNYFGFQPSPNNFIRPGKRPQSSMSPVIVERRGTRKTGRCDFYAATGGAGGSRIISAVAQVLWYVLDRGLNLTEALEAPRLHDQLQPNLVEFEPGYSNGTVADMVSRQHNATRAPRQAAVQVVRRLGDRSFEAAADPVIEGSGGYVF